MSSYQGSHELRERVGRAEALGAFNSPSEFCAPQLPNAMQIYVKHLPFSKFFLHFFSKKISPPLASSPLASSPHCLIACSAFGASSKPTPRHIHTFTHSHIFVTQKNAHYIIILYIIYNAPKIRSHICVNV